MPLTLTTCQQYVAFLRFDVVCKIHWQERMRITVGCVVELLSNATRSVQSRHESKACAIRRRSFALFLNRPTSFQSSARFVDPGTSWEKVLETTQGLRGAKSHMINLHNLFKGHFRSWSMCYKYAYRIPIFCIGQQQQLYL